MAISHKVESYGNARTVLAHFLIGPDPDIAASICPAQPRASVLLANVISQMQKADLRMDASANALNLHRPVILKRTANRTGGTPHITSQYEHI
jgi:hypothetical protein